MKKHLALVLALVMVLTSFSFVSAAPDFSDMEGHVNAEAVARLELLNVLKGYPDGTFKPDDTITRAEFAAVAVRVSGLENVAMAAKGLPTGFNDVPAHHWASGYVGTAAKMGIVVGIGNGLFAPESPVKYEEAITMIVRALGYEPMAQARGGYPFGYLIVANEIDLLDGAMGTQGTWATRGFVAQITDNALEIPMMIQTGYGSDTKWVVSGEEGTTEKYLIEQMGFDSFEGRVVAVDEDDMEIKIDDEGDNEWYNVAEGFDFFATEGVTLKVWADGSDIIAFIPQDTVLFGAVIANDDLDEIEMVLSEDEYDVAEDDDDDLVAVVDTVDYAKVVIGDRDEVVWFEGYDLDEFIVVDLIDDEIIVDLDETEVDVEDFLIVKDGKTISVEDLVDGDVVFYNSDDEFAVVYNETEEGVITRAYTDSFRLDGTSYDLTLEMGLVALFIDGNVMGDLVDELEAYVDGEEEVTVFFDFYGDVVLVVGDRGEGTLTTFGAVLTEDAVVNDGRGTSKFINWDMVNELDEEVSLDEKVASTTTAGAIASKWDVVEYKVDEDGDLDSVEVLEATSESKISGVDNELETDDRYADGKRLQSGTVVFLVDESDDEVDAVFTWADADDHFGEATEYLVYADGADVAYLVVFKSDAGGEFDTVDAVLVKQLKLANGEFEVTFNIEGTTAVYDFETELTTVGAVYTISVTDDYSDIEEDKTKPVSADVTGVLSDVIVRGRTFEIDNVEFVMDRSGVIFEVDGTEFDTISMSDLADLEGSTVEAYYDGDSKTYIKYLVVTVLAD